jgi:D-sedoheptulose 7-phosphate isomerase
MTLKKVDKRRLLVDAAIAATNTKTDLLEQSLDEIIAAAAGLAGIVRKGGIIYLAGNGGSAADCQHFATELVVRLTGKFERPSLPAISLVASSPLLTAAGNDYGFEKVFARQIEGLITKKDTIVLISTSGNSANLIQAAKAAKKKGAKVYSLLGMNGGKLKKISDLSIVVPSKSVQRIQEEHIFIIHNIVQLMEGDLFP